MADQKSLFYEGEGDAWFKRNFESGFNYEETVKNDCILKIYEELEETPSKRVLEIGCSTGWRLWALKERFQCVCYGIDPSPGAIDYGRKSFPHVDLGIGTADNLSFEDSFFDTVILGFCLYLCDRKDLFKIASEVDRVLREKGRIYILDFDPPFAYKNRYSHLEGIYSHKMNYSKMFLWNPAYNPVYHKSFSHHGDYFHSNPDERISVTVLAKDLTCSLPEEPY